jgi:hypothetical protein
MRFNYAIFLIWLLGTIVRVLYAINFEPWLEASDHLAWEILLKLNSWEYKYLIHYPHEGGSILVSILAKLIGVFEKSQLLSVSALILDGFIRLLQILIVKSIWGKKVAVLFGIWMIFSISALLPWSSVVFGLHYISSVFPFVFLWLLNSNKTHRFKPLWMGLFLGLSIWFHYSNFILLLSFVFYYLFFDRNNSKNLLSLFIAFSILVFHFFVRSIVNPGFQLLKLNAFSIRGLDFTLSDNLSMANFLELCTSGLKSIIYSGHNYAGLWLGIFWLVLIMIGLLVTTYKSKSSNKKGLNVTALFVVFSFLILYSISPLYQEFDISEHYFSFRHLAYIIPIFILLVINGFKQIKFKYVGLLLFNILLITSLSSTWFSLQKNKAMHFVRPTGWVLGTKLGHQPQVLYKVINQSQYSKEGLTTGAFWGITQTLFKDCSQLNKEQLSERTKLLFQLVKEYPEEKCDAMGGVMIALGENVRPITCFEAKRKVLTIESYISYDYPK